MRKFTLDVVAFVVLTGAVLAAINHSYAWSAALFVVAVGLAIVW